MRKTKVIHCSCGKDIAITCKTVEVEAPFSFSMNTRVEGASVPDKSGWILCDCGEKAYSVNRFVNAFEKQAKAQA